MRGLVVKVRRVRLVMVAGDVRRGIDDGEGNLNIGGLNGWGAGCWCFIGDRCVGVGIWYYTLCLRSRWWTGD